jgi:hypothetical protein
MLSPSELTSLYNIISEENKTFENISTSFYKTYSKSDYFKVSVTLWFLIKDNLLNLAQKISSFFILYDIYKNEKVNSIPFYPIVIDTLKNTKNKVEKKLLIDFLKDSIKYTKISIKSFIEDSELNEENPLPDLNQYWEKYELNKDKIKIEIKDWIRPIVYEKKSIETTSTNSSPFDLSQLTPQEVSFSYFEPNYMRFYPNQNYPFFDEEPLWITPTLNHNFIFDYKKENDIINLLVKKDNFNEIEKKFIIDGIKKIKLKKYINKITPDFCFNFIEKDYEISKELYISLAINLSENFKNYLNPILEKGFSENSIKILSNIIMEIEIPKEFLITYLRNILNEFDKTNNKQEQTNFAKIISFFCVKLIEKKIINQKDLPNEIKKIFEISGEEIQNLKKLIEI